VDLDPLLTHCRLADGRLVYIGITGGPIAAIGEDTAPSLSNRGPILDIGGDLVLLGLIDSHMAQRTCAPMSTSIPKAA
jgi:dihydroorotase-like cyclic amidohydrolase